MHADHLRVVVAVVGCAVALAACGSSHKANDGGSKASGGVAFAQCMRSHGVPNFPDPGGGGGGIQLGSGINPKAPAFQSAQKACFNLLPGPASRGPVSEARKLQMLRLAQCMRRHGLTTFPDPTSNARSPGSGFGIAFGGPGSFIAVPQTLIQSPGFHQAGVACGFPGAGGTPAKGAPVP